MYTGSLLVAVSLQEDHGTKSIADLLSSLCDSNDMIEEWRFAEAHFEMFPTLDLIAERLTAHFEEGEGRYTVVVSDALVEKQSLSKAAKALFAPHASKPLAMVAVTDHGERVPDIDSVLTPQCGRTELIDVMRRIAARLQYIAPPAASTKPASFLVRRIDGEFELMQYYKLRRRVYSIMGYISPEKERTPIGLEIDGCDVNAIHLGAFERREGYQQLAGTARVLLAAAGEQKWATWTRQILRSDQQLEAIVRNEALPLCLPVFHSQGLNDHLAEAETMGRLCAELSRVIAAPEYRGAGLARMLVNAAIEESVHAGVKRMYLECLDLHEPLYAKFGFKKIDGTGSQVLGVNRSMIAMMRDVQDTDDGQDSADQS